MKLLIKKGTTSKRLAIFVQDSSSTVGAGLTGLVFNSAGLTWYYWREDAANVGGTSVTLVTATRGTFASGGFIEKDATNLPGMYEIGVPDAVLATGANWAVMMLKGATNMAPVTIEIQLEQVPCDITHLVGDPQSATDLKDFADAGYDPSTNKVEGVKLADTLTTYTGNTVQTGDNFARIGANGAGLTLVPWNPAWDVEVQSEATDALNAYDPPTNAEMVARTLVAIDYATAAAVTAVDDFLDTEIGQIVAAVDTEVGLILALLDDPRTEPGQGAPPVNPDLATKIDYLYKAWRNKKIQPLGSSVNFQLFADNGTTIDQKATVVDDGANLTIGGFVTGP